jgi:NAD(P)-dependent dehydrogenase (short-subunit alcohol dehydrogenase family)
MFNALSWADTQGAELVNMELRRFTDVVDAALTTWFATGTVLAKHMAANGGGSIVGITANAARDAYAMVGGFGVACAAVEHFLRQLGVENGQFGVRVGWVRSAGSPDAPGVRRAWTLRAEERGITLAEFEREAGAGAPLRHLPYLAEVADAAVIMASDYARGMTSTFMNVTCGAQTD